MSTRDALTASMRVVSPDVHADLSHFSVHFSEATLGADSGHSQSLMETTHVAANDSSL